MPDPNPNIDLAHTKSLVDAQVASVIEHYNRLKQPGWREWRDFDPGMQAHWIRGQFPWQPEDQRDENYPYFEWQDDNGTWFKIAGL